MFRLTLRLGTSVAAVALAAATAHAAPTATVSKESAGHSYFGAMLDIGAPDLVGVSLIFRPLRSLRLHVGGTSNLISAGIRGGLTYVPFDFWVSPSATIEGGRMFEGDANWLAKKFGFQSEALERIGYDYVNGHLGVEFGSSDGFMFFIHGGISYVVSELHNLQKVVQDELEDPSVTFKDPVLKYFGPSGKIGFILHI